MRLFLFVFCMLCVSWGRRFLKICIMLLCGCWCLLMCCVGVVLCVVFIFFFIGGLYEIVVC